MATNRKQDGDFDDDIDSMDDEIELDLFLDAMETQNDSRQDDNSPRRKIEALLEKQRLKKLLEDYPDDD